MELRKPVNEEDHIKGNINAALEIVEYGDYQCPHCGAAFPLIRKMMEEHCDEIKFVFRNFPLVKTHPFAKAAAMAAEAAALQGKYWEMHDALFEHQRHITTRYLRVLADKLELDIDAFEAALKSDTLSEKVDADFYNGMRSGVNRTPTFFINRKRFDGSPEELKEWIKTYLTHQGDIPGVL